MAWEVKEIDEVCNVEYGTRVVQKRDGGTIFPVYGGGGATFFMDESNREDCLVIARFAMSEKCTRFVKGKFFLNDSGLSIIPKDKNELCQEFLNYQILYLNNYIYSLGRGTAQKNLDVPKFRKMKIHFPKSIKEQKQIVAILDEAFEKISKAKENSEQNLGNSKEVFEVCLQKVFDNLRNNSPINKLGKLCHFVRGPFGGSLKKAYFKPSGIAVYEQQHAINNQFDNIRYFIDENKFKEMKRFELKYGDLIMSCSGTMGKIAIVPKDATKGIINQALLKLTPNDNLNIEFLKVWMESKDFQKQLTKFSKGAAIKNVASVKVLKEIDMPFPSIEEQAQIISKLDNLSEQTKQLESIYSKKLLSLEELKQSILQKAFKGELTEVSA
ncbi:MAG: restriction endonuclease subunit S [Nanoarchaeota archaeon]|nr:restriction endonuclease subunit S [Nanoarchaeota archaeon]